MRALIFNGLEPFGGVAGKAISWRAVGLARMRGRRFVPRSRWPAGDDFERCGVDS
jgi:hypothetical protein